MINVVNSAKAKNIVNTVEAIELLINIVNIFPLPVLFFIIKYCAAINTKNTTMLNASKEYGIPSLIENNNGIAPEDDE